MSTSIEIRRADYTGAGIYRASNSDTRADITGIKLQVDSLQEAITKDLIKVKVINKPDTPRINDLGRGEDNFMLKGTITKAGVVDGFALALDLRYASQYWYQSGAITFTWADEANPSLSVTYTGLLGNVTIQYVAGEVGQFPFTIQFVKGALMSG